MKATFLSCLWWWRKNKGDVPKREDSFQEISLDETKVQVEEEEEEEEEEYYTVPHCVMIGNPISEKEGGIIY